MCGGVRVRVCGGAYVCVDMGVCGCGGESDSVPVGVLCAPVYVLYVTACKCVLLSVVSAVLSYSYCLVHIPQARHSPHT